MTDELHGDTQVEALLPFYGLGNLTDYEKSLVEDYIAAHPEKLEDLDLFDQTATILAYVSEPVTPSFPLSETLLQQAKSTTQPPVTKRTPMAKPDTPKNRVVSRKGWGWLTPLLVSGVAWAIFFFVLLQPMQQTTYQLQQETIALSNTITEQQQQLERLQTQIDIRPAEITSASQPASTLTTHQDQVSQLADDNNTLQETVAKQTTALTTLQAEFELLAAENEALLLEYAAQGLQLETLNDRITTLTEANTHLEQTLDKHLSAIIQISIPNAHVIKLSGIAPYTEAHGYLVANIETKLATLIVADLPALQSDQVYQLWFVHKGQFVASDIFTVERKELNILKLVTVLEMSAFEQLGISIEPVGGSDQPTNSMVMAGDLS